MPAAAVAEMADELATGATSSPRSSLRVNCAAGAGALASGNGKTPLSCGATSSSKGIRLCKFSILGSSILGSSSAGASATGAGRTGATGFEDKPALPALRVEVRSAAGCTSSCVPIQTNGVSCFGAGGAGGGGTYVDWLTRGATAGGGGGGGTNVGGGSGAGVTCATGALTIGAAVGATGGGAITGETAGVLKTGCTSFTGITTGGGAGTTTGGFGAGADTTGAGITGELETAGGAAATGATGLPAENCTPQ